MQILVLLGMYFDVVVVFVTSQTLLFRLALAILWLGMVGLFWQNRRHRRAAAVHPITTCLSRFLDFTPSLVSRFF